MPSLPMSSRVAVPSIDLPQVLTGDVPCASRAVVEDEVLFLFDTLRDQLLRYVCSLGLAVNEGEDVVQDVFLALFKHLRAEGGRTNLRGWLFKVAHNLALKQRARLRRAQTYAVTADPAERILDPARDPEERLAHQERQVRAAAVLNALPELDRRCIHLRGSGLRYREIAGVLGISLGGVAKSLTRSIERLQRGVGS